ncbi:Ubiquitin-like protein [Rhizoctonia solani]
MAAEPPATAQLEALQHYGKRDVSKVVVRFKAVGNAPIMKQNFYKITASNRFQAVIQFLRKELGWQPTDPLVAFSPAPDDTVANLFKDFRNGLTLVTWYIRTKMTINLELVSARNDMNIVMGA